jgi:hypothetical protein
MPTGIMIDMEESMKATFTLAAAVVAMTAAGAWLAPGSAFAQSLSGCESASTTEETSIVEEQGRSGKPAKEDANNQGTTTVTIVEEQAAPKKCPGVVISETETDPPGRN